MKPKVKHRVLNGKDLPELSNLASVVGQFIEYWGFKAVHGKVWLYLYTSHEPLSSLDLARILKISPSLVTQSVQVLLKYKVIEKSPKGANGIMRYHANPDPQIAIAQVLKNREMPMLVQAKNSTRKAVQEAESATSRFKVNSEKLKQIELWCGLFSVFLETAIHSLNDEENPFSKPSKFLDSASDWT